MGIYLPTGLPARITLAREGVLLLDEAQTNRFGISPLRITMLNLMPDKPATETQFARLLGITAQPVTLTLAVPDTYRSKTTPAAYIDRYYRRWSEVRDQRTDALIVTGAPVETLPFEDVYYWRDLEQIFDWAQNTVPSAIYVCWAAQAALFHRHRIPKHELADKAFGVYQHEVRRADAPVLRGLGGTFWMPVSRHTEVRASDIPGNAGVEILAESADTGPGLLQSDTGRSLYLFNHPEYETDTLAEEYKRDREAGRPIRLPENYFPENDASKRPVNNWQLNARLFFSNWLTVVRRNRHAVSAAAA